MTVRELNRDIKRLNKAILADNTEDIKAKYQKEFMRLYLANKDFEDLTATSIKILLRLNLRYRFEALHLFGIYIDLEKI